MGFLRAIYSLGQMASESYKNSPLTDIINFLQLPYPLAEEEKENEKVYAIRIWLDMDGNCEEALNLKGVAHIDRIEYRAIGGEEVDEIKIKERCLYRKPIGNNVSWRFTPLYRLGSGGKNSIKKLVGEKGHWKDDKESRFFKLYHSLLKDYESSGFFTKGSADRIMSDLVAKIDKIAEFWSEGRVHCFIIFGLKACDKFLYPGEVELFVKYFREKLASSTSDDARNDSRSKSVMSCALCQKTRESLMTLDKVFKFATFDKRGFLPGIIRAPDVEEKVFPVCKTCYEVLSAGKEIMEGRFVNFNIITNICLFIVPEIISGRQDLFNRAADHTKNFIKNGIRYETQLFRYLSKQNEGLVFHFLFAERNQAQLIIHTLVEDVSPTHLRKLQDLWTETCLAFAYDNDVSDRKCSLDTAILQIIAVFMSLAGESKQDKEVMRSKVISVISGLLNKEVVGIKETKNLIVSRLAGLVTDPDWLRPSKKGEMSGRQKIKGMAEVIDFLHRINRR